MDDFDEFVAGNLEQLPKTAYLITWDAGEAEDLVQECLFKVARRWPRVRGMAQPRAYARRILVNLALDDARGRSRRGSELDGAAAVAAGPARDLLIGFETGAELLDALARLTPRQRAVLVLRYFNDLTEAQTAEAFPSAPALPAPACPSGAHCAVGYGFGSSGGTPSGGQSTTAIHGGSANGSASASH